MAQAPLWKQQVSQAAPVNFTDMLYAAQSFYNNRFDVIDQVVENMNLQRREGKMTDLAYLGAVQKLADQYRQSQPFVGAEAPIQDLAQQGKEAIAKQTYQSYIDEVQRGIQKMLDQAEINWANTQKDYAAGKITQDFYNAGKEAYYGLMKEKADMRLPVYKYEDWNPEQVPAVGIPEGGVPTEPTYQYGLANLNIYQSGRMRDIERENMVRSQFKSTFGIEPSQQMVEEWASTYLTPSQMAATMKGIRLDEQGKAFMSNLTPHTLDKKATQFMYTGYQGPGSDKYQFPTIGTGGTGNQSNRYTFGG